MKVLVLYSEIAGYVLSSLRQLAETDDVHLVRWKVNDEAPFKFDTGSLEVVVKDEFGGPEGLLVYATKLAPHVIYVSGWIDKDYLKVAKEFKGSIPVILGMDTPWQGSWRQHVASLLSFRLIRPYFSKAFVSGQPQMKYAQKLGFKRSEIETGLYCADTPLFEEYYARRVKRSSHAARKFLYVGRYVPQKGINVLWEAYKLYRERSENPWELTCIGTGELFDERPIIEGVTHLGFVQPEDLGDALENTSVFILPSLYEPWGVVVQEYAVAGYPMICSDKVMAHTRFLNEENGILIQSNNTMELATAMLNMESKNVQEIQSMGNKSHALGMGLTPEDWVDSFHKLSGYVRN